MVLVRNQLVNTFEKVINVELLRIFVQNVSKSNHVSPKPPFPRGRAPPAKRDRQLWGRKLPVKSIKSSGEEHTRIGGT